MYKMALTTALFGALAACTSVAPGDYTMFRIAFADFEAGASCYGEAGEPINEQFDETTYLQPATFAVFRTEDVYYLDMDGLVLSGSKDKDVFKFSGKVVDIDYFGADDASQQESRSDVEVQFTLSGKAVVGSMKETSSETCTGPDCEFFTDSTCTNSADFYGSKIDGVDLQHSLDFDSQR